MEAQFRQTYSLRNLGNGPGIARVAEAQTKATLLSYALPPAPSRPPPWHLRGWGGCWGGIVKVLTAMEVTCTEAEVCAYLLLAAFLPHPPKRLSKGCP